MTQMESSSTPKIRFENAPRREEQSSASPAWDPAQPRDPLAHPAYKPRMEGAARPVYHLSSEPIEAESNDRTTVTRERDELDMAAFVQAVEAAFPEPLDPVGRRISVQGTDFLWHKRGDAEPGECSDLSAADGGFAEARMRSDRPLVRPVMEAAASMMLDLPYDPILEQVVDYRSEAPRRSASTPVARELSAADHSLIHAVIEPLEPAAKPGFPMRPVGGVARRP